MTCSVTDMLANDGPAGNLRDAAGQPDRIELTRARVVDRLFERYRERLLRYLTGLLRSVEDAEDIAQECYARLLEVENLESGEAQVRAYIFRIATNLAYDRFRSRRARGTKVELKEAALLDDGLDPSDIVGFDQCIAIIKQTVVDLRPRSRQVFLMRVSEQLSYEQIADRLSISTRTVEREMRHAIDLCQRRLKFERHS